MTFHNPLGSGPAQPPAQKRQAPPTKPGPNSKPDKGVNHGAVPNMMGDVKRNPKPTVHRIASSAGAPRVSADTTSGVSSSMAALADKLHPTGR